MRLQLVHSLIPLCFGVANAGVTVWQLGTTQIPLGMSVTATSTSSNAAASYTGAAAYNPTVLKPPPVPNPGPGNFDIQLPSTGGIPGMSIPLAGSFFGFSVEFSVANQVLGKNSSLLQVPFLNLMANLVARGGRVDVRVGGNTQETASLVASIPNGADLTKDYSNTQNPTATPPLVYNADILYMMSNISDLVNVKWYLGLPFNDTSHFRLQIAEVGEAILGDKLLGLQVGNEPDLYSRHGHRPDSYSPADYGSDFGLMVKALANDPLVLNHSNLIGPNLAGLWTPEDIWNTGFVPTYDSSLCALAVEHYPTDNCAATFGIGTPVDAQAVFPDFLTHKSGQSIVNPYLNSTAYAQTVHKPFIMFETNSASCGGFAGISDAFGAALWAADYGLQMAYSNFSSALFHVGGQSTFYNPFTPPPTNQSSFHQWTVGPIYYAAMVVAETIGASGKAQIMDLNANGGNELTPAYAVYENGKPVRVALFNYITDPSGGSTYTATIALGDATPAQVQVKYLAADSVSQKGNYTWAGQTFGGNFGSDGRLNGTLDIQTVTCNGGTCQVKVPAPSFALVFLSDAALAESNAPSQTYSTTVYPKGFHSAIIDPSVLATSNGHQAFAQHGGSTSQGSASAAFGVSQAMPSIAALIAVAAGSWLISRSYTR